MTIITTKALKKAKNNYKKNYQDLDDLTSLQKHVYAFGEFDKNGKMVFSTTSIANRVRKQGEKSPLLVGLLVNFFNATNARKCPFGNSTFAANSKKDFGDFLHLGTFRLFNKDGSFSEEGFKEVFGDQQSISQSELLAKLKIKNDFLPYENDTGRNANSFFSNSTFQKFSIKQAWKEVFVLLCHDWQPTTKDASEYEPVVDLKLIKLFYENSLLAFELATVLELPRSKESVIELEALSTAPQC